MRFALTLLAMALAISPAMAGGDYLPIAVGDEWTMDVTMTSPNGETAQGLFRRRIESAGERQGRKYVRARSWTVGLPQRSETSKLLRKDEHGVYSINEMIEGSSEQIEVSLPLEVGSTWQQIEGAKKMTTTVLGLENVDIAGKTYGNCYHIRISTDGGGYTEDFWEAPIVGNVKSVISFGSGLKITLTIKQFKSIE